MKQYKLLTLLGAFSLLVLFTIAALTTSRGRAMEATVSIAQPGAAAARNAQLKVDLKWTFGGKQQRGWYLYTQLISRLIDTTSDPSTDGFATALGRWQKRNGLNSTGILDDETLYKIIGVWQERRLKDRSPADPARLVTAPPSEFYDPTRAEELRQIDRETFDAYKQMLTAAIADKSLGLRHVSKKDLAPGEKYLKIISAYRSRDYQEKLRRETPNAGRAGLAVNSPHFTGRALDLYVGGDPVETNDPNRSIQVQTRVYLWLVRNAERYGFQPYFYEPWHWEYVGKR